MSELHPNLIAIQKAVEAFNRNDIAAATAFISPDVVYRIAGNSPIAGEHHGIAAFAGLIEIIKRLSNDTVRIQIEETLVNDSTVVLVTRVQAEREGRVLDQPQIYQYRFDDDGRIIEGRTVPVDLYAYDAFWA
ncbi:nuclear transport factor 2 family protein [Amaricoccus tamworthensis]|uniref:nuclear transport factor 2 family protein n=1 Tax=Amaricoccus tamworthensis TaxID=57002 RepID=UPI003C7E120A